MKMIFIKSIVQVQLIAVIYLITNLNTSEQVRMTEEEWVLPTYHVAPPDKNPMFFRGESYQGASRIVYPYGLNDVISHEKTYYGWKALMLENEYIKLCITPEIRGKLYYATDKTNGYISFIKIMSSNPQTSG